jgi:hypothetical protein
VPLHASPRAQLLSSWAFVTDLPAALAPACGLELLLHCTPKLRSLVARVLDQGAGGGSEALECFPSCPGVLQVLHWFEGHADASGRAGADIAAAAADQLLSDQCATLRSLLLRASKEMHSDAHAPAAGARGGACGRWGRPGSPWKGGRQGGGGLIGAAGGGGDGGAARDQLQPRGGEGGYGAAHSHGPPNNVSTLASSLVMRASYLASAMDQIGAVQVGRRGRGRGEVWGARAPEGRAPRLQPPRRRLEPRSGSACPPLHLGCPPPPPPRSRHPQISCRVVKVPREYMRAGLQRAVHELVDSCAGGVGSRRGRGVAARPGVEGYRALA